MRLLIAVLLSVALIGLHQDHNSHFNNSEAKVAATSSTGQVHHKVTAPEVKAEQIETPAPQPPVPQTPPTKYDLMNQAGISPSDYSAVDYIITHESSWRFTATEPTTQAFGLCQALPATKMASAGTDWQTNPVTQLKWCSQYATDRYGGWQQAYARWIAYRWW